MPTVSSNTLMTPVVATLPGRPVTDPAPDEVARVFDVALADLVADAIADQRVWVFPHPDFVEMAELRWRTIAEGQNPAGLADVPGLPPSEQIAAEVAASLGELAAE